MDPLLSPPVDESPLPQAAGPLAVEQFDEQGRLVLRCTRVDDVLHGPLEQADPESGGRLKVRFHEGRMDGPMFLYDAGGALVQSCSYQAGHLHGPMKIFDHGRCISQQEYVKGQLHGPSLAFDEAGRPCAHLHYVAGVLEGSAEFFHEGRCVRRSFYHQDLLEGESTDYAPDGAVVQTCTYRANLLHGPLRRFWPDGQLMEEVLYEQGVSVADPIRRDPRGREVQDPKTRPSLGERLQRLVRGG